MDSLRNKILKKLQAEHSDLIKAKPVAIKLIDFLLPKENWMYVFFSTFLLLCLFSLPGPKFLQFIVLDWETVKLLIESRITTIVTIISMTLAVTGLLLSNLAIKNNLTYELMFRRSGLYFIIYFALSSIIILISISMLRNTLDPVVFGRLVLAAGYICLLVIFGIGFLFRIIVEFTTPKSIEAHLRKALFEEYKANLCYDLLKNYSLDEFRFIMEKANIKELSTLERLHAESQNKDEEMFIEDIRLDVLKKIIRTVEQPSAVSYILIGINTHTKHHKSFLNLIDSSTLSSCLVLQPSKGRNSIERQYFKYFSDKLDEYSKEGKHERVAEILDIFVEMYGIEFRQTIK